MRNTLPVFRKLTSFDFAARIRLNAAMQANRLKIIWEKFRVGNFWRRKSVRLAAALFCALLLAVTVKPVGNSVHRTALNLESPWQPLHPLTAGKNTGEVFGFAPYWAFNQMGGIDFSTLTTLAYFGVPVSPTGDLDTYDQGYITFQSPQATDLFRRAHENGTSVVLTLTQMNNANITALLDDPDAQNNAINQAVSEVQSRGIDGINVDMEYDGDPGPEYRDKFTNFVANLDSAMHQANPHAKVTVSVYADSVKDPKIYDIARLWSVSDGIFMMAYDFATAGSDTAMPTSPLYGYKEGTYWYDVSTAVDDFLTKMPANKLILGIPWYGYNYLVYQPGVDVPTYNSWWAGPVSQTYAAFQENVATDRPDIIATDQGWDNLGEVGWKAYYSTESGAWRMIFLEDSRSLSLKYDFAKAKHLAGVGIWALGFDGAQGKELWQVLKDKFGSKLADHSVVTKAIAERGSYE